MTDLKVRTIVLKSGVVYFNSSSTINHSIKTGCIAIQLNEIHWCWVPLNEILLYYPK